MKGNHCRNRIAGQTKNVRVAAMAEHDYQTNIRAKKEIETLMMVNQQQLELIQKLYDRLDKRS